MPFPLADGAGSPVLDEIVGGPAAALTAVALVVGPEARASGWGARAAISLAQRWRGPRRILLADLDLEQPALHDAAGVPNEEGVIDLVDYGISLGRLIRAAAGGAFDLLPAGIFTPSPGEVLRHAGWARVLLEVAARRGTLLAWVPADADGADRVVERAGAVLVLAEADEAHRVVERLAHPYAVLAILTPEAPPAASAEPPATPEPAALMDVVAPEPAATTFAVASDVASPPAADDVPTEAEVVADREPVFVLEEDAVVDAVADEQAVADATATSVEPATAAPSPATPEVDVSPAAPGLEASPAAPGPETLPAAPLSGTAADDVEAPPASPEAAPVAPVRAERLARRPDAEFEKIRLPKDAAAREALIAELRERQRTARLAGASVAGHTLGGEEPAAAGEATSTPGAAAALASRPAARPPIDVPVVDPSRKAPRRASRFSRPLLWTVGVVLLASLLAGAWHFLSGRLRPVEPAVAVPVPEPGPAAPAAPLVQNALPYVVAIEAHRDLLTAFERVTDLQEIEPELLFHVETLERGGSLFYHVMAGPVADSAAALALRDTLIARGHKTGPTPTDVRATPLAFLIGDYATAAVAEQQRDVLRRLDIPGYVLQGRATDGQPLFRLYVGGFGTEAESDIVGQLLRAAGIQDSLVTRTGSTLVTDSLVTPTDSSNS